MLALFSFWAQESGLDVFVILKSRESDESKNII